MNTDQDTNLRNLDRNEYKMEEAEVELRQLKSSEHTFWYI